MTSASDTPAEKYKSRRRAVALIAGLSALFAVGYIGWKRHSPETPVVTAPEVSLDGVDPEIVETIESARGAVFQNPHSASHWGRLGHVFRAHGFDEESDECYTQAEQLDGDDARWPYLQAERRAKHDPAGALPKMKQALDRCAPGTKQQAVVALHLVRLFVQLNRLDEAERTLRVVSSSDAAAGHFHWHAGLIAVERNSLEEAADHFQRALDSPFTRKSACIRISAVYRRLGQNAMSSEYAQRAETMPGNVPWPNPFLQEYEELQVGIQARYLRIDQLEKQGRFREAAELCRAEVERAPSARAFTSYGILLARLGEYERSEQLLTAAVKEDPRKIQAHYFLAAVSYFQAKRLQEREPDRARAFFQRAVEHAERTLEIKHDHGYAFLFLGRGLMELGRTAEAVTAFGSAVRCRPEIAEMHSDLGRALLKVGRARDGNRELELAAKLRSAQTDNAANRSGTE